MNKYFSIAALISYVFALSGCTANSAYTSARIAVLQNPETKQTVQCKADPWGSINFAGQIDNCIKVYEKAGYKKVADSSDE